MNFLDIKSGDDLEVGTQIAFRFWRYVFPSHEAPLRLLSYVSPLRWRPKTPVEATSPDFEQQGIHGFKTMEDLLFAVRGDPSNLITRSKITGCDGVVIGTVALWGIIWQHTRGYRAQFARPTSFTSAYGERTACALTELQTRFLS
jgi:hypothetical protein